MEQHKSCVHPSSSSAFPSYISGVHHFWVRFVCVWPFFNPTIVVVTFRLRGWCMLDVASIPPSRTWMSGSSESVRCNTYVHRLDLSLHSHPKEFLGNGARTHVYSKGKIPSTGKILLRGLNLQRCIKQDSKPNTLPTSYSPLPPPPPQPPTFFTWAAPPADHSLTQLSVK